MKKLIAILSIAALMLIAPVVQPVSAEIVMTVDSGPWYETDTAWFNQAKADTVNGSFVNLRTGTYPGTNNVDPVDFLNNQHVLHRRAKTALLAVLHTQRDGCQHPGERLAPEPSWS